MNLGRQDKSRLLGLVWPFVLVVLIQAFVAVGSLYAISSVRAYIGGESLWSKAQKQAIYHLTRYVDTAELRHFELFRQSIAVPLAGRAARLELDKPRPNHAEVARSLAEGGNHPDDIDSLIFLYTSFRGISYLEQAIDRWRAADEAIVELAAMASAIRAEYALGMPSPDRVQTIKDGIERQDSKITPLAYAFSETLSEGSRFIRNVLFFANLAIAAILIVLAFWITRRLLAQREKAEAALNAERERAGITLASIGEAVISTDTSGRIEYMNAAAERLIGYSERAAQGKLLESLVQIRDRRNGAVVDDLIGRILREGLAGMEGQANTLAAADGSTSTVSIGGAPLVVDGATTGAILVLHDRGSEDDYLDRLSWQASHDSLTGCANRRAFEEKLASMLAARRNGAGDAALMFIDLDQFKVVNDTCGHAAGDQMLRQLAGVLADCLRSGDLLARLGGDEFGVLVASGGADYAERLAERLRQTVHKLNFVWNGRQFAVTASIGLVNFVGDITTTVEEAMRAADLACYAAKEKGRNRIQVYRQDDSDLESRVNEMSWVHRIYDALERDRFILYAQQIAPICGNGGSGAHIELLVRMLDSRGDAVSPERFIPAAERFGLMPQLDRWVVQHALATLARRGTQLECPVAICAINLSGATFTDDGFVDFVRDQFAAHGISPALVCFEITETSAITNLSSAIRFIKALKALGCRFALDDFGSGMSSFAYLKHLPVDYLKIDGGFVKDMLADRIDRAMVEMIHHIGKVTGKQTIAEFVETPEVVAALAEIGVDYGQGFAFDRPQPFTADTALRDLSHLANSDDGDPAAAASTPRTIRRLKARTT